MSTPFSLSMSVYRNDDAEHFRLAVESATVRQTVPPSEVVLVVDGPVPGEIDEVIARLQAELPMEMRVIRLPQNVGHAGARQRGLVDTRYPIVAIMDSDDVCDATRFEKQLRYMEEHPEVDVVGAQITEFVEREENIVGSRIVPCEDRGVKDYLKARCPMNLVTVVFRKESVLEVGGFMEWYCEEDYYLWVRLAEKGYRFGNVDEALVNVRVGKEMYQRRGGWRYFKSEARLQGYMLRHRVIGLPRYGYNVCGRFAVQVLMPNGLRGFVFQKLFRKQ